MHAGDFFSTFQGQDEKVSIIFAHNFDGFETFVGRVLIHIIDHFIETRSRLPIYRQMWWKKETLVMDILTIF